jgi:hypothetical protein
MKSMKLISMCLLALTGVLFVARGEQLRTDINPALLYYQAFLLAPNLSEADWDYLQTNNWQGQKLPERFGTVVSNFDTELKLLRQAAQQKMPCDWGIDLSRGPETLLPHLASAKRAAYGARFHAMWDLENGNEAEARDDLIAGLALGRNVSQNSTLVSILVGFAVESMVNTTVAGNFHRFSPETLQQLADGFAAAPARGTVADCLTREKPIYRKWLPDKIKELRDEYPGDDVAVMEGLHQLVGNFDTNYWEELTNAAGGTIGGIIKISNDAEPLYAQLAKILVLPHGEYEEQMKQFSAEVEKSGNYLFSHNFPGWQASRRREFISLEDTAMVRAAIEYKLHGEAGLKSVTDPCGNGPFTFQRFVFDGVDRGFELKSAYNRGHGPEAYIFVEKDGPPFNVMGDKVGQPISQ